MSILARAGAIPGLAIIFLSQTTVASGLHGHIGLGSDYAFRGVLQTESGPALEANLEYLFESGLYTGIWVGRLDVEQGGQRHAELDYFVGLQHKLSRTLTLDTAAIYYTYPKARGDLDREWTQLVINLHLGNQLSLGIGIEENWLGFDKTTHFADIKYNHLLFEKFELDVTASYQHTARVLADNYHYFELGLSRSLGPLQARLALSGTTSKARRIFADRADTRWISSITWSF